MGFLARYQAILALLDFLCWRFGLPSQGLIFQTQRLLRRRPLASRRGDPTHLIRILRITVALLCSTTGSNSTPGKRPEP